MTAVEMGVGSDLLEVVLQVVPFRSHSPSEQAALISLAERADNRELQRNLRSPLPPRAPRAAREAHQQGIDNIELGRADSDGISYRPLVMPDCISFHNIDARGRTEFGHGRSPWLLTSQDLSAMERCGAEWFDPFMKRLADSEDFTIVDLKQAHHAATGQPLRFNTIVS